MMPIIKIMIKFKIKVNYSSHDIKTRICIFRNIKGDRTVNYDITLHLTRFNDKSNEFDHLIKPFKSYGNFRSKVLTFIVKNNVIDKAKKSGRDSEYFLHC